MSIQIDHESVTAVFALNQWHYVVSGTFDIDAYELMTDSGFVPLEHDDGAIWEAQCGSLIAMPLSEIKAFKFEKTPS